MPLLSESGMELLGPARPSEPELTAATRAALGRDVDVVALQCAPIAYSWGSPATAGLWRVDVEASDRAGITRYSFFVKLLRHPRLWPGLEVIPVDERAMFVEQFPWTFELEMAQCGMDEVLPAGMRLPALHHVQRSDGDHLGLWWEYVEQRQTSWQLADYARAALLLGRLAARRAEGKAVNDRLPNTSRVEPRGYALRMYVGSAVLRGVVPRLRGDQLWRHPLLAEFADPTLGSDMVALADRIPALLDRLDALPQTYAHGDASPQNLLLAADEAESLVVIDWGFGSLLAVGFDLGQLLIGRMHAGEVDPSELSGIERTIFPAYLEGLRMEGFLSDPAVVREGFIASLVARSALTSLPLEVLERPATDELRTLLDQRVRLTRTLVDLAAEV